jgi:hypothetical protein
MVIKKRLKELKVVPSTREAKNPNLTQNKTTLDQIATNHTKTQ